jgi:hypothetical protein
MNITIDQIDSWDGYTIYWVYYGTSNERIPLDPDDLCYYVEGAIDLLANYIHESEISKQDIEEAFRDSWTYNEDAGLVDWEEEPPAELVVETNSYGATIYKFQKI